MNSFIDIISAEPVKDADGFVNHGDTVLASVRAYFEQKNSTEKWRNMSQSSEVAIGFRAKKSNGKYRYFWLYRVVFGIPATNLQTKGDSITFSTPTIEGTVYRRNKLDGNGKHPWKSEVNEDDTSVPASVITGWYTQVYEPTFAAPVGGGE